MCRLIAVFCLMAGLVLGQAKLEIGGAVWKPYSVTEAELKAMPRQTVALKEAKYEGVWLADLLKKAEPKTRAEFGYVVVRAEDGYRAVFALAELDLAYQESKVLVADTLNSEKLRGEAGPIRLVVVGDKKGARWVRRLVKVDVEVVQN